MKRFRFLATLALTFTTHGFLWAEQAPTKAQALLEKIDRGQPLKLKNAQITGDLDFTQLRDKRAGGSYGGRVGRVKEFYTQVNVPLVFENCEFTGSIVTFREERKRLLLKEYFVRIQSPITFKNCTFRKPVTFERLLFSKLVIIQDCVFEEPLRFEKMKFKDSPIINGNRYKKGIKNRKTNWTGKSLIQTTTQSKKERSKSSSGLSVTLKNPSFKSVQIEFGKHRWNLSPLGHSTLQAQPGTAIYLYEKGKRQRILLTLGKEIDGKTFDVTRL